MRDYSEEGYGGKPKRRFDRGGRRDFGRSFGDRRSSGPREMHEITCDKCGKISEVPFKPTSGKPIFCKDCFSKNDNRGSRGSGSSNQLDEINAKLDKIMNALHIE